jgi:hypothetical protein
VEDLVLNDQMIDYSKIDEVTEDGVRLTKILMRLEFALKDAGYVVAGQRQAAEVQWDRYANEKLGSAFWSKIKGATSAAALIETPPKRQVVDQGGNLAWEEAGAVESVQELVGALRRVRNNLFHGGKSGDPDAERNARLYAASLYIIDQILREDDIVRTIFTGQY